MEQMELDFYEERKDHYMNKAFIDSTKVRLTELERRVAALEAAAGQAPASSVDRCAEVRAKASAILGVMEEKGIASFAGMTTSGSAEKVIACGEMAGIVIERCHGNSRIINNVIKKRYGLGQKNDHLVAKGEEVGAA